jgi:hypothetical protein
MLAGENVHPVQSLEGFEFDVKRCTSDSVASIFQTVVREEKRHEAFLHRER